MNDLSETPLQVTREDLANVDALDFVEKLHTKAIGEDRDMWALEKGEYPGWLRLVDRTKEGLDFAMAYVLKRHGLAPAYIAMRVSSYQYGATSKHDDPQYLNEVLRKAGVFAPSQTLPGSSSQGFDAPYMADLWGDDIATKWLIQNVLEEGVVAEIWGESGSLKTFIAIDMAAAVASKQAYHNEQVLRQGPVLVIPGEGRQGLKKRVRVLCQKRGLGRDIKIRIASRPVMLSQANQAQWLRDQITGFDIPPALIVIDTLARNFGGNENSTEDMNAFIDSATMLAQTFGATVLIIHHCGLDTTHSRGNSALHCGIDNEYHAAVDPKTKLVKLTNIKMKDTEPRGPIYFQRQVVKLLDENNEVVMSDGKPVDSLVLNVNDAHREAERDAWFEEHPQFKGIKRIPRLVGVLRHASRNPETSPNAMRLAVEPDAKDNHWITDLRKLMTNAELIEGDHFKLTEKGKEALRIFDDFTNLSQPKTKPT